MAKIVENTPQRLVLRSGSNTLTLDKSAGTATLQGKILFFSLKPAERLLAEIATVKIDDVKDPASGAMVSHTMVVMRGGDAWVLAANDRKAAEAAAAAVGAFVGLPVT